MKKAALLFLCFLAQFVLAQKPEFSVLLQDKISIRALQIYDGKVWYSGTDSKFGYVSLKDTADKKQLKLSEKKLQFRTLAQDQHSFYAINIESPAYFFRIDKKTLKSEIINTDASKNAFYDALYFHRNRFYTFSDPEDDLQLKFAELMMNAENFNAKYYSDYLLKSGEAAFAASNTNIAASKKYVWLATGGKFSRIFSKFMDKANYNILCICVILFIIILVILITGLLGLLVLIVSSLLGITFSLIGIGKNHLMGCLLLPVILFFLL